MICQINGALTFFVYNLNCFFLRLIITCGLWIIYVREDNYSIVQVMIKRLIWTIWTLMSSVLKKAVKLNLSLSPCERANDFVYQDGMGNMGNTEQQHCLCINDFMVSGRPKIRARFLSLAQSKLRLCLANHRAGYLSNLPCDWPSAAWAYSEEETENGPRFHWCFSLNQIWREKLVE